MDMVEGLSDTEQRRLFCQTLFNRLMFIYFLQRKGWLKFDGDTDYLKALHKASKRNPGENFFSTGSRCSFWRA